MQRGLTLEGKESQAKVGTLFMRGRYSSVRLVVYSQWFRVPLFLLWEQLWKARPQNKSQLMVPTEVKRVNRSKKEIIPGNYVSTKQNVVSGLGPDSCCGHVQHTVHIEIRKINS